MRLCTTLVAIVFLSPFVVAQADVKLKALIVDGQNNHEIWPKTTAMMKAYLEETGLFRVDVERTAFTWPGADLIAKYPLTGAEKTTVTEQPKADPNFAPEFSKYDVVVCNFGWKASPWPQKTQTAFEEFVRQGGGLVILHAADNSFPGWAEYNKMIGLGGWGDRTEKDGPYVYLDSAGKVVRDHTPGSAGAHGPQHAFQIMVRDDAHPITRGMPQKWMHTKDELYSNLRGPAENMRILATAYSDPKHRGTGRHEPMILTISYGKGRVFHTPMGHSDYSLESTGFIVTFKRGAEWAATGEVTQKTIPQDFPTANQASRRAFE